MWNDSAVSFRENEIALDELYCPAYVLDVRESVQRGESISVEALDAAIGRVGGRLSPGCAALIRTGQENDRPGDAAYYFSASFNQRIADEGVDLRGDRMLSPPHEPRCRCLCARSAVLGLRHTALERFGGRHYTGLC